MMQSPELFTLIKALSQTEKAWFKRYSRLHVRGGTNNYVLLFDAIEAQTEYDEQALLKKFKGRGFIRQFSVAKNYLYGQILNAMHYYHHSVHGEMKKIIHQAEFLIEKGLFRHAEKLIIRGKKFAEDHELHWALIELNHHWEYRMAITTYDWDRIKKFYTDEIGRIDVLQNLLTYRNLFITVSSQTTRKGYNREKGSDIIRKMFRGKEYHDVKYARTFRSKVLFLQAHFTNAYYSGRHAEAFDFLFRKIQLYDSFPEKIRQEPYYYGNSIHNAITLSLNIGSHEKIGGLLDKMEATIALCKNEVHRKNLYSLFAYQRLAFLLRTGNFDQALTEASAALAELNDSRMKVDSIETIFLLLNIAVVHFIARDLKTCIRILSLVNNEFSFKIHAEDESFFRIFRLIVHFEAGNYEEMPYYIQSTYRFLKKKEQLREFESIIISFLQRLLSRNENRNIMKDLIVVKDQLVGQVKKEYEENVLLKFDIVGWLESKIENKPFVEVLKRKIAANHNKI